MLYKSINSLALIANIKKIKSLAGNKKICAVVKCNAYGHGIKKIAKILAPYAHYFAVNNVAEANKIAGLNLPVLVLMPSRRISQFSNCEYCVQNFEDIDFFEKCEKPVNVHLKIDTGFNRLGFCGEDVFVAYKKILNSRSLKLCGVLTHFATAKGKFFKRQLTLFKQIVAKLNLNKNVCISAFSSSQIIAGNKVFGNTVRTGIALYGGEKGFLPVKTVRAKICAVKNVEKGGRVGYGCEFKAKKKTKVAIVAAGYADGLMRSFAKKGSLIAMGRKTKILGRICMTMCAVDVSGIEVKVGDFVEIYGNRQSAALVAACAKTISYEILTKI